jgi:hypothetical protein
MAVAAMIAGGIDELLDLALGQVFPRAQLGVGRPARCNCPIYSRWRVGSSARIFQGKCPLCQSYCPYKERFTESSQGQMRRQRQIW